MILVILTNLSSCIVSQDQRRSTLRQEGKNLVFVVSWLVIDFDVLTTTLLEVLLFAHRGPAGAAHNTRSWMFNG